MSFDLHLERFVDGESGPVDRVPVLQRVRQYIQQPRDHRGTYILGFPEGILVEFHAKGLESEDSFSGCAFYLRKITPLLLTFIFELAVAGDMVIFDMQGSGDSPILVEESQMAHLPEECSNPVVCTSPKHLGQLFAPGFDGWSKLLDTALRDQGAS